MPGGANIIHTTAVKMLVSGTGNLDMTLKGLNDVVTSSLNVFALGTTPSRERLRLTNFVGEYVKLRIGQDVIDEVASVERITFFIKPLYTQYPGLD